MAQEKGKGTLSGGKKKDKEYYAEQRKKALSISMQSCKNATTNREMANSEGFKTLCGVADVKPTKRQASKYRRKMGKAYTASQSL